MLSKQTNQVPLDKQSKRDRKQHYAAKRGDWGLVYPVTRVVPSKKVYDRKKLGKPQQD